MKLTHFTKGFEEAIEAGTRGFTYINTDRYGSIPKKYHLFDDYYIYKRKLFVYSRNHSGDWYVDILSLSTESLDSLYRKLQVKIVEIQRAKRMLKI